MTTTLEQLNDDYDWREAFGYAGEEGTCATSCQDGPNVESMDDTPTTLFTRADVAHIEHAVEGEPDEADWLMVGRLNDGRHFYLTAGCDYTGWD
jgi:hypothetical protein